MVMVVMDVVMVVVMDMVLWQHLSWSAAGDVEMMSEASFKAFDDFCSPSAAITCSFIMKRDRIIKKKIKINTLGQKHDIG